MKYANWVCAKVRGGRMSEKIKKEIIESCKLPTRSFINIVINKLIILIVI